MGIFHHIQQFIASHLPVTPAEDGVTTLQIQSYDQENSGLKMDEVQRIMQWVSASIYTAGYTGESHVFWLLPQTDQQRRLRRLYRKGDMVLGYRCGDSS